MRIAAFHQALEGLGWTVDRNIRLEIRWAVGDPDRIRKFANELAGLAQSVWYRRQACANAIREIGCSVSRLRGRVDQRAPAQLVERQRGVDPARVVEVAVDEAIEKMADVEPALPACGIQIANDVDRAAVAQEMVPFRPVGKLVDPFEVDQQHSRTFSTGALRR